MYEMYLLCRSADLIIFRKPTGKKDGSEKIVVVVWPTGFTTMPSVGGWEQQPYITTRLFAAAMRGEQQGASRLMAKP
jgi:hypothetical protein